MTFFCRDIRDIIETYRPPDSNLVARTDHRKQPSQPYQRRLSLASSSSSPPEEDDVSDYTFTHTDALNFLLTKYLRQLAPSLHQKFPSLDSIVFEEEPQQVEQLPLVKQFKLEATPVIHESRYVITT